MKKNNSEKEILAFLKSEGAIEVTEEQVGNLEFYNILMPKKRKASKKAKLVATL